MADRDITLWVNEHWYDALNKHLGSGVLEDKLNDCIDELISQLPKKEYDRVGKMICDEEKLEKERNEQAKTFTVFRIKQDGQESLLSIERELDFLAAAVQLRNNIRNESEPFYLYLTKRFPCNEITQEEYRELVMKRLENTGMVAGAYEIDLDSGEFSALHILDGWKTFSVKDVSTAAYFAMNPKDGNRLYHMRLFLDRLAGKELSPSFVPLSIRGSRQLTAEDITFSDEVILRDGKLNFYVNCNFDVDEVFGTHVCTDANDDWLNVYAEYDIASAQVDKHLVLNLCQGDGHETTMVYLLSPEEREMLHHKMEEYCEQDPQNFFESLTDPGFDMS